MSHARTRTELWVGTLHGARVHWAPPPHTGLNRWGHRAPLWVTSSQAEGSVLTTLEHSQTGGNKKGSCCGPRARVVPLPQKGELRQCHLQPRLPGPCVAAENVQDNGEPIEHLHAPDGLQLFLGKESA